MKRRVVWLAISGTSAALLLVAWIVYARRNGDLPKRDAPLPPLTESRYWSTRPDARYVGIEACKECHANNYNSYLHTAHSRALSEVNPANEPTDVTFEHEASGRTYRVHRVGKELRHEELLRTAEGKELARLDLPVRYLVGSGTFARTYLVEDDGFLNESPITWYAQRKTWNMSPGYDLPSHFSFQRPVTIECLSCHTGRVEAKQETGHRVSILERPIGCETCHGPGSHHVEFHRSNKPAPGGDDWTIVNPGKLSRPLLESVCASCHLQGAAATIQVRGRKLNDFRPGMPLADYRIDYNFESDNGQMTVVGHVDQLRQSACYQKSDELSCVTCHNPHLREKPKDVTAFYRQKCMSCHESHGCSLAEAERLKREPKDSCVACHMPRGTTDVPHVAFTHHRIGKHAAAPPRHEGDGIAELVAVFDAPGLSELDRKRNLGLGYVMAATRASSLQHAEAYAAKGRETLESVLHAGLRDATTLEGLATLYGKVQDYAQARPLAQEALKQDGVSVEEQRKLLEILLESYVYERQLDEAVAVLERLTRLRRYAEDWRLLGACRLEMNEPKKALPALERALAIDPFRPRVHAGLADVYRRLGDNTRAREHTDAAEALAAAVKR